MRMADVQNICVLVVALRVILNSESFLNCLTAKARSSPLF